MIKTEEEIMAFDMYFASICSMQYHPGAGTKEHKKLSVQECRDMALEMLDTRRELISKIVED
jgi:anthranilate/para-aminobenzoate synthase component II